MKAAALIAGGAYLLSTSTWDIVGVVMIAVGMLCD